MLLEHCGNVSQQVIMEIWKRIWMPCSAKCRRLNQDRISQNSAYYVKYKVAIKMLYMIWYMTNWVSSVTQQVKICLQCKRHRINSWVRKIPWRRNWQPALVFLPEKNPKDRGGDWWITVHGSKKVGHYWANKLALSLQLIDILCSSSFSFFLLLFANFLENLCFFE